MKLTAILLTFACLQVSARIDGQTVTLKVKDAPMKEVFLAIQKQTGLNVMVDQALLEKAGKVTLDVRNMPVAEVLNICLKNEPLNYTIADGLIVVRPKPTVAFQPTVTPPNINEPPPPIDVRGRVVNENGEPVSGASVQVKGDKTKGTSTDADGYFTLKGIDENSTLVISAVTIEEFSVKVNGKTDLATLNVKTKVTTGETVTVNTGYQQLKPNEVTGSVVVITKEQLDQRVAPDIISKLEGITNSLVFNRTPSGDIKIRIRGESTLYGYTEPLIVLDNFPYDGNINNINPNDIENVTVLKDAAAASIWGVQAGNGVIVITTKRGKYNKPLQIELNTNFTVNEKPDLWYGSQISSSDFIDIEQFLFDKGFYTAKENDLNKPALSQVVEILIKKRDNLITAVDAETQINALRKNDVRNDLTDRVYRIQTSQQYAINLNGGSNKTAYYFSGSYDKTNSLITGNKNDRIVINSQNTFSPFKNLELGAGLLYMQAKVENNGISNINNLSPYSQLVNAQGVEIAIPQHRALFEDTINNHNFLNWQYYPLSERHFKDNRVSTFDTRLSCGFKYSLLKGLRIEGNYQFNSSVIKGSELSRKESYGIRNSMNTFAILANGNYSGSNYPDGGLMNISNSDLKSHNGRVSINYNRNWSHHAINTIIGFDVREVRTESNSHNLFGFDETTGKFVVPNYYAVYSTYFGGSSTIVDPQNIFSYSGTLSRFRSYFSNAAYTYKQRYTLSASGRIDGSNYFGVETNKKSVPLWSAGFKWEINEEPFYKLKEFSLLALRVSYGYNGNLAPNVAAVTTFQYLGNDTYTGLPWAKINNIPNPELRWEKTSHFNIGLDFSTRKEKIAGTIEYFHKKGDDLIGDAILDPTSGVTQLRGNFSGMKSNGIDIKLRTLNISGKTINWTTGFIFNYVSDKVTRFDIPGNALDYVFAYVNLKPLVGKPVYGLYSYRWGGLDPNNGNPRGYLGDTLTTNYSDLLSGKTTTEYLVYSGRYNPPVFGTLQNTFSWKGISLSVNMTYKLGYYFRRASLNYGNLFNNGWRGKGMADFQNRWRNTGDEVFTEVPSMIYPANSQRDNFYSLSEVLVEKADHVRLQFINLSYNLSQIQLKGMPFKSLQIYLYANNVGIIWRANKKGIDPDYQNANFPSSKSLSFGIKAGF